MLLSRDIIQLLSIALSEYYIGGRSYGLHPYIKQAMAMSG
jgi:hypothetical protein